MVVSGIKIGSVIVVLVEGVVIDEKEIRSFVWGMKAMLLYRDKHPPQHHSWRPF